MRDVSRYRPNQGEKMTHEIPDEIPNSRLEHCIDEYVRLERDRAILRSHWFGGKSFVELTEKYDLSLTAVKNIIWKQGDKVLLKASKPG